MRANCEVGKALAVRINRGARLDPSQVDDERGASGGGFGIPVGALAGGGGGIVGLVILVLSLVMRGGGGGGLGVDGTSSNLASQCTSGAAAAQRTDCRVVAVVNSVQAYWASALPAQGADYSNAPTVLYTDAISTGCGDATSAVGPFYCPPDGRVYLDLSFFDDLRTKLGAQGGAFAQAYVIAHEYGHHVQDLLGIEDRVGNSSQGATSASVRLELQADCLAGVWARHAQETKLIEDVSASDIHDALDAASAVGDDRLQRAATGSVNPDSFTHGTSAQRDRWFSRGYDGGTLDGCDTFAASTL